MRIIIFVTVTLFLLRFVHSSSDDVVRVFERALSSKEIDTITKEITYVFDRRQDDSKHLKPKSLFVPLDTHGRLMKDDEVENPRLAIERAVETLYRIAYPNKTNEDEVVRGAEIWGQARSLGSSIHPHFDKDEYTFQTKNIMSTPKHSTVTYLTVSNTFLFARKLRYMAYEISSHDTRSRLPTGSGRTDVGL